MTRMITLRVTDERIARIDALVRDGAGSSRSAVITAALDRFLESQERHRIDEALVEGYSRVPQTTGEREAARVATIRSIAADPW